jgi:predicted acyl esterase
VLRLFDPDGEEVTFQGALDPRSPLAHGWLRASHRRLDQSRSTPWRPYHTHTEYQPLRPDEVYELEVEIWPTSIVAPRGYRIGLSVRGNDYRYEGSAQGDSISTFKNPFTGVGPFLHDDPGDRPTGVFGGITTIHGGPVHDSSVLLPFIPRSR